MDTAELSPYISSSWRVLRRLAKDVAGWVQSCRCSSGCWGTAGAKGPRLLHGFVISFSSLCCFLSRPPPLPLQIFDFFPPCVYLKQPRGLVTGAAGSTGFRRHFYGFLTTAIGLFRSRNSSYLLHPQLGMETACRGGLGKSDCAFSFLAVGLTGFAPRVAPVAAALTVPGCWTGPPDSVFSSQLPPALPGSCEQEP